MPKKDNKQDESHQQKADKIHQLVTIMRLKRGNRKRYARDNIRTWLRHGLRAGLSYDDLKALTIEIIKEDKLKKSP